jgi:capping protein beta
MRRLPPNKVEQNVNALLNLLPDDQDELLQRIDQALEVETDTDTGKSFICCDYNRDGDSHRSPWSNKYFPPLTDAFGPSEKLRAMEVDFNLLFDNYRELYYDGGTSTSSVYLWDLDGGFAACFLIKKTVNSDKSQYVDDATWDSIHVIEVTEKNDGKEAAYKLTTTVTLHMDVKKAEVGKTNLSGSLSRQAALESAVNEDKTHIANMGRMVEDMETTVRNGMSELYISKTREVVGNIRRPSETVDGEAALKSSHVNTLNAAILANPRASK